MDDFDILPYEAHYKVMHRSVEYIELRTPPGLYKQPVIQQTSAYIEQARSQTLLLHESQRRKRKTYTTKKSPLKAKDKNGRKRNKVKMPTAMNSDLNKDLVPTSQSDNPMPYLTIGRSSPEPLIPNLPKLQALDTTTHNITQKLQKYANSLLQSTNVEKANENCQAAVHGVDGTQSFVPPSVLNKANMTTSLCNEADIVEDTGNYEQNNESLPRFYAAVSLSISLKLQIQNLSKIEFLLSQMQQKKTILQKPTHKEPSHKELNLTGETSNCSVSTQSRPLSPHYTIITTDADPLKMRFKKSEGTTVTYNNGQTITYPEKNRIIPAGGDVDIYMNLSRKRLTAEIRTLPESSYHSEKETYTQRFDPNSQIKQTSRDNYNKRIFAPTTIDGLSKHNQDKDSQAQTYNCKQKARSHKANVLRGSISDAVITKQKVSGNIIGKDNAEMITPVSGNHGTIYTASSPCGKEVQLPMNYIHKKPNIQKTASMPSYKEINGIKNTNIKDIMEPSKVAFHKNFPDLIKLKSPNTQSIFEILQAEWYVDNNDTLRDVEKYEDKLENEEILCNTEENLHEFKDSKHYTNDVNGTQAPKIKNSEHKSLNTNKVRTHPSQSPIPNFYSKVKTPANIVKGIRATQNKFASRKDESAKRTREFNGHKKTINGYKMATKLQNFSDVSTAMLISVTTKQNSNEFLPTIESVIFKEGPVTAAQLNADSPRQEPLNNTTKPRKIFHCNHLGCKYTSIRQCHLNVHLLGHTNDKKHKCTICSYGYNVRWKLEIHMKRAHLYKVKTDNQPNEKEHPKALEKSQELIQEDVCDKNKNIKTLPTSDNLTKEVKKEEEIVQENLKSKVEKTNNVNENCLNDYLACFDDLLSDDDEYEIDVLPKKSTNNEKEDILVNEVTRVQEATESKRIPDLESDAYVNVPLSGSESSSSHDGKSVSNISCMKRKNPEACWGILNCQTKRRKITE